MLSGEEEPPGRAERPLSARATTGNKAVAQEDEIVEPEDIKISLK